MREASSSRAVSAAVDARIHDARTLRLPTCRQLNSPSAVSSSERVRALLRRAMMFLESDREAAWRCVSNASALLDPETPLADANVSGAVDVSRAGGLCGWQANRALAYIEVNLDSRMDIGALAELVAYSKSHFSRAFKRRLGLPPMAYVAVRRVERAKAMMSSTSEQLTAIALACGFADQSHLNRSFRRMVGMSPGVWRRTQARGVR